MIPVLAKPLLVPLVAAALWLMSLSPAPAENLLIIHKSPDWTVGGGEGWVVTHQGPEAAEIIDLFGTDTLPTPYSTNTPIEVVREHIQRLNPNHKVVVR